MNSRQYTTKIPLIIHILINFNVLVTNLKEVTFYFQFNDFSFFVFRKMMNYYFNTLKLYHIIIKLFHFLILNASEFITSDRW